MKLKLHIAALAIVTLSSAQAASVAVQSGFGYGIVDNSGVAPAVGSGYLAVGYFSSLSDVSLATSSAAVLAADFQVFGGDSATFGASGFGGLFNIAADTGDRIDSSNPFVGNNIYFIAANGVDIASSTQALIYKFADVFVADPAQPTPPSSQILTPDTTAANYMLGTNDATYNFGIEVPAGRMAVLVPEPSAALLGVLGALGLLRRRRA